MVCALFSTQAFAWSFMAAPFVITAARPVPGSACPAGQCFEKLAGANKAKYESQE